MACFGCILLKINFAKNLQNKKKRPIFDIVKRLLTKQNLNIMANFKNTWSIIKSDMTKNEKNVAELLREIYTLQKGHSAIKVIKTFRNDLKEFNLPYTEKELQNACAFHNILDEYCKTI